MELRDMKTLILGLTNRLKKTVLTIQGKVDVDFPETQKVEVTNQLPIVESVKVSNLDEVVSTLQTSVGEVAKLLSKPQAKPEEIKPSLIKGLADVKKAVTSIKIPENKDLSKKFDEVVSAIGKIKLEEKEINFEELEKKLEDITTLLGSLLRFDEVKVYLNEKQVEKLAKATGVAVSASNKNVGIMGMRDDGTLVALTTHAFNGHSPLDVFVHDSNIHIPSGDVDGHATVNKFGRATAITTGNTWEIWDGNAAYVWPTGATITHIRSAVDSATTQGVTIEVQGLDTNWALTTQTVDTDGTNSETEVALTTPLRRIFRMKVLDAAVMDEDIWAGDDDMATVAEARAIITAGNNQTLMAIYTVPAGKTAYMSNYYCTANPGGGAPTTFNVAMWARDNTNGYAPQLKHIQGVAADVDAYGRMQHQFAPYYKFDQRTDIFLTGSPTGASVDTSAGFDLILVDN